RDIPEQPADDVGEAPPVKNKWGMWERYAVSSCRFEQQGGGEGFSYKDYGVPAYSYEAKDDGTIMVFVLRYPAEEGEWKVTVRGRRLNRILDLIDMQKLRLLRVGEDGDGSVTSIQIEPPEPPPQP